MPKKRRGSEISQDGLSDIADESRDSISSVSTTFSETVEPPKKKKRVEQVRRKTQHEVC